MAVHDLLAGGADWLLREAVSYDLGAPLPSAPPLLSRYTHDGCDWFTGICSVPDRVTWLATGTDRTASCRRSRRAGASGRCAPMVSGDRGGPRERRPAARRSRAPARAPVPGRCAGATGEDVTARRPRSPRRFGCCGSMGRRRLGRGRAEGAEELVAEGAHWLERSGGTGQQPVLPAPGGNLPEHRRVAGDNRDRHLVAGPGAADRASGLLVAEQDEHEVWVVELGDP